MKLTGTLALAGALALTAGSTAFAATLDDFNRPDSATLGPGWTQQAGSAGIVGGQAFSEGTQQSLATFNGGTGNTVSFDISNPTDTDGYVAAVLGWGSAFDYFVKVQANSGNQVAGDDAVFNTFSFGHGNNFDDTFDLLSSNFTAAHVVVSVVGTLATLDITPNVGAEQIYTHNYGPGLSGGAIGLGFDFDPHADNFGGAAVNGGVPEPASWALMLLGFGGLGAALRARRRLALA
jgi:hypothetical protein